MYRTSAQIEQWVEVLADTFDECTRTPLPEVTVDGARVHMLTLRAGEEGDRRGVLLIGGTHARELMNPDLLLELAADLLVAYEDGSDVVYGGRVWSANIIRLILETLEISIVCNVNPDGRDFVFSTDAWWRKNRRSDLPGTCDGVDLNRNVEPLWSTVPGSSCDPCSDTYAGPSAFSEAESRNIRWVLDNRRVDCLVDVHSYSELVLYPWGHAPTQTADPSQRFTGLPAGTCRRVLPATYAEYMDPVDLQRYEAVAQAAVDAIAAVRGRSYTAQAGVDLYPTTGTHGDYPYSRHISDPEARRTYSFTFETGPNTGSNPFQPADPTPIKEEARSGLIAVMQQAICAIILIGTEFLGGPRAGKAMRVLRDEVLSRTPPGRGWIALFERNQVELALLALEDREAGALMATLVEGVEDVMAGEAEVDEQHVELVEAVVERLIPRLLTESARRDLEVVLNQIRRSVGQGRDELVEDLLSRAPGV